jgi:hypothetical protein
MYKTIAEPVALGELSWIRETTARDARRKRYPAHTSGSPIRKTLAPTPSTTPTLATQPGIMTSGTIHVR